ncbi:MAG: bifunctional phosphopantothenoylcysteine decarboxylase/phosphopantothenate--cysteine ligase CoaBC [Succinivibrio sp.]|nr:bifunctional phosphopantothenoylcysteine decarboxylase/phosphopantothenate--cysteine ligase CoaBC [Succinivibrio sp.]
MSQRLKDKNIALGVTGGIAAYKAATLCRLLIKEGAQVHVLMTRAATAMVSSTTFAALSGNPVSIEVFEHPDSISHIAAAKSSDLIVVAPASANTLAKMACGMADNMVTCAVLAADCPIVLCPAMNAKMYLNPATQQNLKTLAYRGMYIMTPNEGELACGTSGPGRMPEPEDIVEFICKVLMNKNLAGRIELNDHTMLPPPEKPLEIGQTKLLPKAQGTGLKVLITAGPTAEALDPVRIFTNKSTGKMGFALAEAARNRGAEVTLVTGPVKLETPASVRRIAVNSAIEMLQAVEREVDHCDIVIGCAAVSDYRPETVAPTKLTSEQNGETLTIRMVKNPDIIATVGKLEKHRPYTVGFAAETDHEREHACAKLERKHLDLICMNNVLQEGVGFGSDENEVTVFDRDGEVAHYSKTSKTKLSEELIDLIFATAKKYLKERTDA